MQGGKSFERGDPDVYIEGMGELDGKDGARGSGRIMGNCK